METVDFNELAPPYTTIVADPPWPYETRVKGTRALPAQLVADGSRLQRPVTDWTYEAMSLDDLSVLPVKSVAAKDAHLYLWTTNSFMEQAHGLARAWGFKPKTILTWVKTHQKDATRVSMKTGYYFRGATEHVLFCVRGSLKLQVSEGVPTAFLWPRIGQHSRKPEAFMELVERCSPGPYLEMFARNERPGWSSWGNQIAEQEAA